MLPTDEFEFLRKGNFFHLVPVTHVIVGKVHDLSHLCTELLYLSKKTKLYILIGLFQIRKLGDRHFPCKTTTLLTLAGHENPETHKQ